MESPQPLAPSEMNHSDAETSGDFAHPYRRKQHRRHDSEDELDKTLAGLHSDELMQLADHPRAKKAIRELSYPFLVINTIAKYIKFWFETWAKVAWCAVFHPFSAFQNGPHALCAD
jgi:hypothetical protein